MKMRETGHFGSKYTILTQFYPVSLHNCFFFVRRKLRFKRGILLLSQKINKKQPSSHTIE